MKRPVALALAFGLAACSPARTATIATGDEADSSDEAGAEVGDGDEVGLPPAPTSGDDESGHFDDEGGDDPRFDIGVQPPDPPPEWTCPAPPFGTQVAGTGPLGEFSGSVAYLGEWHGTLEWFRLVILDDSADVDAEVDYALQNWDYVDKGPALIIMPNFEDGVWPATTVTTIAHFDDGFEEYFMGSLTVEEVIEADDAPDLPAVMSGHFDLWPDDDAQGVSGDFVAVYCRAYDDKIIAE